MALDLWVCLVRKLVLQVLPSLTVLVWSGLVSPAQHCTESTSSVVIFAPVSYTHLRAHETEADL
eukprot:3634398-Amphidinium_carterae.1